MFQLNCQWVEIKYHGAIQNWCWQLFVNVIMLFLNISWHFPQLFFSPWLASLINIILINIYNLWRKHVNIPGFSWRIKLLWQTFSYNLLLHSKVLLPISFLAVSNSLILVNCTLFQPSSHTHHPTHTHIQNYQKKIGRGHWLPMATNNFPIHYQYTIIFLTKFSQIMIGANWYKNMLYFMLTKHCQ